MAITTYTGLAGSIAAWLNRSDLDARIPDFIRLAEARMNRVIRDPDMIAITPLSFTGGAATLPADFLEIISLGSSIPRYARLTINEFAAYDSSAVDPIVYTVAGQSLLLKPTGSASVSFTYYRTIPALSEVNQTNWLLTRAPDLYLWGALLEAEVYGWNDERIPLIKAGWDEGLTEFRADGVNRAYGSGALSPRVKRT